MFVRATIRRAPGTLGRTRLGDWTDWLQALNPVNQAKAVYALATPAPAARPAGIIGTAWNWWSSGFNASQLPQTLPTQQQGQQSADDRIRSYGIDPATGNLLGPQYADSFRQRTGVDPYDSTAVQAWINAVRAGVWKELNDNFQKNLPKPVDWTKVLLYGGLGLGATILGATAIRSMGRN